MPQFINDNLIWLIIIGSVLVLALIGYIAEKNGFGTNTKKDSKKEDKIENEKIPVDSTKEEVITEGESDLNDDNSTLNEESPIDISDELDSKDDFELENADNKSATPVEPVEESTDEISIEEPSVEPVEESTDEKSFEEPSVEPVEEPADEKSLEEPTVEPTKESTDEISFEEPTIEPVGETNIEKPEEDLYAPFGDQEFNKTDLNIDDDFNKILNDVDEAAKATDTKEVESAVNTVEDDDIWKF